MTWSGIGITMYGTQADTYMSTLLSNGIYEIRDLRDYTDTSGVAAVKASFITATGNGARCVFGVSSNPTIITAENWDTFATAVKSAALWAQNNNMFEFQIGNEEETHYYHICLEGSIVRASNVTTITFTSPHGFSGDYDVTVQNTYSDFDGTYAMTVIDSTHISYPNTGANGTCVGDWSYVSDITQAEIITNLKVLAAECQAIFTNGNVSYACIDHAIDDWVTAGRGNIDLIASNIYQNGYPGYDFDTDWQANINALVAGFGVGHTYISEFSLSFNGLTDYNADINVCAAALTDMIDYIKASGMTRAMYFTMKDFSGYDGGVVESDGTTYKTAIWNALLDSGEVIEIFATERAIFDDTLGITEELTMTAIELSASERMRVLDSLVFSFGTPPVIISPAIRFIRNPQILIRGKV